MIEERFGCADYDVAAALVQEDVHPDGNKPLEYQR
jgi:hypothetical protein